MARHFYAAYTPYSTQFTYETGGYTVLRFRTKAERDAWVDADDYHGGNPHREAISRKTAQRIVGKYVVAIPVEDGKYERLEPDMLYESTWEDLD